MAEYAAENDRIASRLRQLAHDLDVYSYSINDGHVGQVAAEMESLAEQLTYVIPPAGGES